MLVVTLQFLLRLPNTLEPFIRGKKCRDLPNFVHCRALVANNVSTGVSTVPSNRN